MSNRKPMHVLQVVSGLHLGGVQSVVMNWYRNIDRNKVQFDFAVSAKERECLEEEAEALGGRIFRLPDPNADRGAYKRAMVDLLREHPEIDAVHAHMNYLNYLPLEAARSCGCGRRISHSHNCYEASSRLVAAARVPLRARIRSVATDWWACSQKAGFWLYGNLLGSDPRAKVVSNGIDASRYTFDIAARERTRAELGIGTETPTFVCVGSLTNPKNHEFLFEAFSEFQNSYGGCLLCVGGGDRRQALESLADDMGIAESVLMLGWREDPTPYLAAADVLLMPSLFEGLPLATVEGQAEGLPCIVSEAVPREVDFTGNVLWAQLDAKTWADEMAEALGTSEAVARVTYSDALRGTDYDLQRVVKILEESYLQDE